jgi:hypothetical protein
MSLAYRRHREALERLINEFEPQLRASIIEELREYARVGEYGLGFELLCNMLFESSVRIPQATFTQIEASGTDLGLLPKRWMYLQPLVAGDALES